MFTYWFLARCALNKDNIPVLLTHNLRYPTEKRIQTITLPDKPHFEVKQLGFLQAYRKFLHHAVFLWLKSEIYVKKCKVSWGSGESRESGKQEFHRLCLYPRCWKQQVKISRLILPYLAHPRVRYLAYTSDLVSFWSKWAWHVQSESLCSNITI